MTDTFDDIDNALLGSHLAVRALGTEVDAAMSRRAMAFALANEKGRSSGDIARLLGVTPMQALHIVRTGHRLLNQRRARQERRAA